METKNQDYPDDFIKYIQSVTNKRAKIVIDHILKHGFITTEDLENTYKYSHPPRAARDVREAGIPLVTFSTKSITGKSIAAYKFGDPNSVKRDRIAGRITFTKKFKTKLYEKYNGHCSICNGEFEERYLQVDHRVPYQIAGDLVSIIDEKEYLLLCGSCNRAKSWSCEHCKNWSEILDPNICLQCYWGDPLSYLHIALENVRRLDIQWSAEEIEQYDKFKLLSEYKGITVIELLKEVMSESIEKPK